MCGCMENGRGWGGGRSKTEELKIYQTSGYIDGVKDHRGGFHLLPGRPPPPPQISINTSSTGRVEQALRRRGVWLGRFRGGKPGIGWKPVGKQEASGGSLSLTVAVIIGNKKI